MKNKIRKIIKDAIKKIDIEPQEIEVTQSEHADFACNVAFSLTKTLKKNPMWIAHEIINHIKEHENFKFKVAKPGFINITVAMKEKAKILNDSFFNGGAFFKARNWNKKLINIEFVSANPTGFLHLGHARNAAYGSSLANILEHAGFKVDREYYVNNVGNQMDKLGKSLLFRYKELYQIKLDPKELEDLYRGADIIECAKALIAEKGEKYINSEYQDCRDEFVKFAENWFIKRIMHDLNNFKTTFNIIYYESDLYVKKATIANAIAGLKNTYKKDGALWFRTTKYGDDKDRVLLKSDKKMTYFVSDVAYHRVKINRKKYDKLINVWGADHFGYIARVQASLAAYGSPEGLLKIETIQMVKVIKHGQNLKMSKRLGTAITMQDLIKEVGVDAARYYLTQKTNNSSVIFDIDLAKSKSQDNQVFYVQYAHARANQLVKKLIAQGVVPTKIDKLTNSLEAMELMNHLLNFNDLIQDIAKNHLIHLLNFYLFNLAKKFHSYYNSKRIINSPIAGENLLLVRTTQQVLVIALRLLGISAPNQM